MNYTIDQMKRLAMLRAMHMFVEEAELEGADIDQIRAAIPPDIDQQYKKMTTEVLAEATRMPLDELEELARQIQPSHLAFQLARQILYRKKQVE